MGLKNEERDDIEASADVEESLPLYHAGPSDLTHEVKLPDPNATSDEVRDYLVYVTRSRGFPLDRARRVAARWTVGRGKELRSYDMAMYRNIFGPDEDGWIVYAAVKADVYGENKHWPLRTRTKVYLLLACFSGLCTSIGLANVVDADSVLWLTLIAILGVISVLGMIVLFISFTVSSDPEKVAEEELRNRWSQPPASAPVQQQ